MGQLDYIWLDGVGGGNNADIDVDVGADAN